MDTDFKPITKVAYLCDRKKCEECHEYCHHTTDITHAKNFKVDKIGDDWAYMEKYR